MFVFSCRGLHPVPDKEVIAMYEGSHVPLEIMSDFYGKVGEPLFHRSVPDLLFILHVYATKAVFSDAAGLKPRPDDVWSLGAAPLCLHDSNLDSSIYLQYWY